MLEYKNKIYILCPEPLNDINLLKHFFWLALFFQGCYSFKGIDIAPNVKTFTVKTFALAPRSGQLEAGYGLASNPPPTLGQVFSERLKDKIRSESRLTFLRENGDVEFSGKVVGYIISAEAPKADQSVSFNRLTIEVEVEFLNRKNNKDKWTQNFSFFTNFASSQNLASVQDALIKTINDQLVENIFNKAFTNW